MISNATTTQAEVEEEVSARFWAETAEELLCEAEEWKQLCPSRTAVLQAPVTWTGAGGDLYLVIPAEVWGDDQADAEDGACDGLDAGLHRDGRNLVDALFDRGANTHVVQHVTWRRDGPQ